jgi:hypothetical protein
MTTIWAVPMGLIWTKSVTSPTKDRDVGAEAKRLALGPPQMQAFPPLVDEQVERGKRQQREQR